MFDAMAPALFALFLWWASTGVIIYLDGLPRHTYRWSMVGITVLSLGAIYAIAETRNDTTVASAYIAFVSALILWAWHEMSFLMGYITGSRRTALPKGATGFKRFQYAWEAICHHELWLFFTVVVLFVALMACANQLAAWTFAALWVLRLSAKFNVFLGVPNMAHEILPPHLTYLKSYFRTAPMNPLFPVSIVLGTAATSALILAAVLVSTPFLATAATFLATLTALAVIEHWFLVLPFRDAALWSWAVSPVSAPANQSDGADRNSFASAPSLNHQPPTSERRGPTATSVPVAPLTHATPRPTLKVATTRA